MCSDDLNISEFKGKVFKSIDKKEEGGEDSIIFTTDKGEVYKMSHEQDCCESVYIESINGDLKDLIDSPILLAEEVTETGDDGWYTYTWTFYKIGTIKGTVTIRWNGESNGFYSEEVSIVEET